MVNALFRCTFSKNQEKSATENIRKFVFVARQEAKNYFQQYGVSIEGFEKQDIEQIKITLSGADDTISVLQGVENRISKIQYNPNLKVMGKMSSSGIMQIGKAGLKDYGTGARETAHAFDFYKSGGGRTIF